VPPWPNAARPPVALPPVPVLAPDLPPVLVALDTQSQAALVPNDGRLQLQVVVTSNTHFSVVPSVGAVQVSPSSGSSIGQVAAFEELPPLDEALPQRHVRARDDFGRLRIIGACRDPNESADDCE
jgi:hypothetical protein